MQETKDPAIKLFGQKIPFPWESEAPAIAGDENDSPAAMEEEEREIDESEPEEEEEEEVKDLGDKVQLVIWLRRQETFFVLRRLCIG